jgi:feruloyl-CoA synthase
MRTASCSSSTRSKDIIIVGGENVYSLEVEEAIIAHERVADVAVVAKPDPQWGEQVVAFITTVDGSQFGVEELRDYLADKLARYKLPREVIVTDDLPRNPSGKLLKHKLRAEVAAAG